MENVNFCLKLWEIVVFLGIWQVSTPKFYRLLAKTKLCDPLNILIVHWKIHKLLVIAATEINFGFEQKTQKHRSFVSLEA